MDEQKEVVPQIPAATSLEEIEGLDVPANVPGPITEVPKDIENSNNDKKDVVEDKPSYFRILGNKLSKGFHTLGEACDAGMENYDKRYVDIQESIVQNYDKATKYVSGKSKESGLTDFFVKTKDTTVSTFNDVLESNTTKSVQSKVMSAWNYFASKVDQGEKITEEQKKARENAKKIHELYRDD